MKKIFLYCLPFCLLFASCSDLLDEESYSETGKGNYLNNAKEAETVLQGVYKNLANEYTYSYHLSLLFTISTDIAQCEGSSTTSFREIPTNSHNASTSQISRTWQQLYSAIYDANDFIETVSDRMDGWGSSDRELAAIYLGEARALRALFYFELVRWYGNVVLMTSTADSRKKDEDYEQSAAEDVYAYIEEDLKYAAEVLPWAVDDTKRTSNAYRFSKGAALGLLAKVYCTWAGYPVRDESKWAEAEKVAGEIESELEQDIPEYTFPPITLLDEGGAGNAVEAGAELRNNSRRLAETLKSFGVDARAGDVVRGPSVTRYEFTLDQGVKLSKITNLADDIALALGASGVRIAPIPDKISVVGIEVPNKLVSAVHIRDVLESREFTQHKSSVAFAVGKDIAGNNIIGNIAKLPHVLIAGTTGSGKSVCTNSLIVSLLYKSTPDEVRFIMVDPKMVELAPYNGIPHLLIPVVTDPKKAAGALQWAVYEMMKRYKMFSEHNVKDLASYNKVAETDETLKKLPSVVVVIDELADLMLVAAKEVEESICRVAQMGRAAGMHLVIATQRPSADVITGLMKANIPSRIAFAVASAMESRIILDTAGAEKLVGRGDMLYAPLGEGKPKRVQGCFISSEEIERVVNFVKENGETDYDESVIDKINAAVAEKEKGSGKGGSNAAPEQNAADEADELLPAAIDVVMETGQASVSMLQRRLKLGYSRAARIVDEMETRGIVGQFEGSKPRQLLITKEQWQELKMKGAYGATPPEAEELPPPDEEN